MHLQPSSWQRELIALARRLARERFAHLFPRGTSTTIDCSTLGDGPGADDVGVAGGGGGGGGLGRKVRAASLLCPAERPALRNLTLGPSPEGRGRAFHNQRSL